jgi:hypothetical protein
MPIRTLPACTPVSVEVCIFRFDLTTISSHTLARYSMNSSAVADRTRLEYIIGHGHVGNEEARAALLDLISRSDEAVSLCAARFPAKTFPGQPATMLHCVRCHEDFDPVYNTGDKCTVDHIEDGEEEHTWSETIGPCGCPMSSSGTHWAPEYEFVSDFCYEGPHTTDKAEVDETESTRTLREDCSQCNRPKKPAKKK